LGNDAARVKHRRKSVRRRLATPGSPPTPFSLWFVALRETSFVVGCFPKPWLMSKHLKRSELSDEAIEMIAARFKLLGESTRLKLLIALEHGERNVTELVAAVGVGQANVSRHLAALSTAGLVARRKEGVSVYYSIVDSAIFNLCEHVCGSLRQQLAGKGAAAKLFGG
jgi:DNA-binding transcriptional ArsR family regulator